MIKHLSPITKASFKCFLIQENSMDAIVTNFNYATQERMSVAIDFWNMAYNSGCFKKIEHFLIGKNGYAYGGE